MSEHRLDALARRLAGTQPRRHAIGALASVIAVGLFRPVAAGCKKVGKKCDQNNDCCDGAKCKKDKCACKSGRQECGGTCYHLDRDEKHCGSCNIQCEEDEGEICSNGRCVNVPS